MNIQTTDKLPGYGSKEYEASREFSFGNEKVVGYTKALERLNAKAESYADGPVGKDRQAFLVLGPPAAGKSTISEKISGAVKAALIDADDAAPHMAEFGNGIGANAVHEEASDLAARVLISQLDHGHNVIIPKIGHKADSINKICDALKERGYDIHIVEVHTDINEISRRLVTRYLDTGRLVNLEYLRGVDGKPERLYHELIKSNKIKSHVQIIDDSVSGGEGYVLAVAQAGARWGRSVPGGRVAAHDAWKEAEHPRGQPDNAGSFVVKGEVASPEEHRARHKEVRKYLDMVANLQGRQDSKTVSVEQFVRDHGKPFVPTADSYKGKRGTPKLCFMNAVQDAWANPERTYVEGYITVHGVPIMHAWTVDENGNVFDQTIKPGPEVGGYYGVPFSRAYLNKALAKNKVYGLLGYQSMKALAPLLHVDAKFDPKAADYPFADVKHDEVAQDAFIESEHPRNEAGEFVYHGTKPEYIESIKKHGLTGGQDPNYFSSEQKAALRYSYGGGVLLRAARKNVLGLEYAGHSTFGGVNEKTTARVAPEHLEYFEQGQWKKLLDDLKAHDAFIESEHPRGQPENAGEFAKVEGSSSKRALNSVVDKWVTTHWTERKQITKKQVADLANVYPQAKFSGQAYRAVHIDMGKITKGLYKVRAKTPQDLEKARKERDDFTVQYWKEIAKYEELIEGGEQIAQQRLLDAIKEETRPDQCSSWSTDMEGVEACLSVVRKANQDAPVQFKDANENVWPLIIAAPVSGLSLIKVSDLIEDKSKKREVEATKEVIVYSGADKYQILGYQDQEDNKWKLPEFEPVIAVMKDHEEQAHDAFVESEHPRGQPENAGEFAKGSGNKSSAHDFADSDDDEAAKEIIKLREDLGIENIPDEFKRAINFYFSPQEQGYVQINNALRSGKPLSPELSEYCEKLKALIDSTAGIKEPVMLYRGTAFGKGADPLNTVRRVENGTGFTSTSITTSQPGYFMSKYDGDSADRYLLQIEAGVGTKGLPLSGGGEAEFILPPGVKIEWEAVREPSDKEKRLVSEKFMVITGRIVPAEQAHDAFIESETKALQ